MNKNKTDYLIDLNKFDKNKKWIIFYKKGCSSCHNAIKYFDTKGIKYHTYDLNTKNGLAMAAFWDVLGECEKWIPIIIEDKGE